VTLTIIPVSQVNDEPTKRCVVCGHALAKQATKEKHGLPSEYWTTRLTDNSRHRLKDALIFVRDIPCVRRCLIPILKPRPFHLVRCCDQSLEAPLLHNLIRLVQKLAFPNYLPGPFARLAFLKTSRFNENRIAKKQRAKKFPVANGCERNGIHVRKVTSQTSDPRQSQQAMRDRLAIRSL